MQGRTRWWLGLGVAAGVGLAACSGMHDPHEPMPTATVKAAPLPLEYDVPSLLGLRAAELAARLGVPQPTPADYHDPVTMPLEQRGALTDSSALFRAGKLPIVASFDAKGYRVIELIVLGSDEEQLMQQAGLDLNARNYLLLSVFKARPGNQLIGIRIVPIELSQP